MADTQSTTKFKADISQLRSEMQAASRLAKVANSEFKAATSGMDDWSKSADGLQQKIKQLNTILTAQKKQLSLAKQEWEKTKKAYGENSAEADRAKIKLNNLQASVGRTEKELRKYEGELEHVGEESKDAGKDVEKSSEGFTVMKGVLADLVATGIKAAIQGMKNLAGAAKEAYQEFDAGQDAVIKATGATGKEAEKLRETYKNVIKSVGGEFDQLGATIGEINTRMGFEDVDLEKATAEFQKFAKITGTDATEAVRLVSRAMGDAGIDVNQYGEVLDLLTTASQKSGIEIGTLAEQLTKYGAPMRNLGFDTKESVAIFSSWEKAGVNTEIAFSGMRKAISNWSKDGKDAREEFKKTLKEIDSTPDRAKATQKAIEVFGSKAGPDLADAILEGRFAYEDFLSSLEGSTGTVDATFQETLDASDKIKLAMQGAKAEIGAFTAEILEKYEPQIEEAIRKGTEKAKEIVSFVIQNKDAIIGALTAIGTVMGTVFVVDKVNTFMTTMKTFSGMIAPMAAKVGLLTAAEGAAEGATLGLNAAMLANPAIWLAGGLAVLTAAAIKMGREHAKAVQQERDLSAAQKESVKAVKEAADQYKQTNDAKADAIKNSETEFAYIQHLKDEYNGLIGSNGKVKKGYEDRANFIIGQLAESLGIERSEIEKNIGKNGELTASIDKLIEKKKAEAILAAGQGAYQEAINKQQESYTNLVNAQNSATEAQKAYENSILTSGNILGQYEQMLARTPSSAEMFRKAHADIIAEQQALRDNMEKTKSSFQTAEQTYIGYNATIANYENLSAAIMSGSSKKIGDAVLKMKNNFVTAETGTKQSLTNQTNNLKQSLVQMKQAMADGSPYVTQEMVNEMQKLVTASEKELTKLGPAAKKQGNTVGSYYSSGLSGTKGKSKKAGTAVGKAGADGTKTGQKNAKKTGQKTGQEYAKGIDSAKRKAKKSGEDLSKDTKKGVEKTAKESKKSGQKLSQDYAEGIKSKKNSAKSAGTSVGSSGKSGIQQGQGRAGENAGKDLGEGYARGIRSKIPAARAAAASLAKAGTKQIPKTQKSHSPSKITKQYGKDFSDGYIVGISSMEGALVRTVKGLVKSVTTTMADLAGYDFSGIGTAASSVFSEAIGKKVSYTIDKMTYQNEAKLAAFDSKISELESKKSSKTNELQKASDKKQDKIQKKIDKASSSKTKKRLQKQLNEEKSRVAKQIKASEKSYTKLINEQNKYKTAYQEASSKMISEFQNALSEYQSKAQALIDDTINGITTNYQTRYDELIAKQDQLIEKLKGAGELFEVSGAGVMTIGDLKQQTAAINDYAQKLQTIKNKVSADLFNQITTYDMKEGSAFLDRLLAMSSADLEAYNQAYTEKMEAAQKAGESIYKADFTRIKDDYEKEISAAFAGLPKKLEELGKQTMEGFVKGFTTNTDYMNKTVKFFVNNMVSTFKKELGIKSPSRVMYEIGEYTVGGFTDALKDGIKQVQAIVEDIVVETATPLSNMDINPGTVRTVANRSLTAPASSTSNTVTNNYNLVQNNTSPKPLTALETYQARRRQVSMVKAMTQAV